MRVENRSAQFQLHQCYLDLFQAQTFVAKILHSHQLLYQLL